MLREMIGFPTPESIAWDAWKVRQSVWTPTPEVKARRARIEAARLNQPLSELKRKFDKASGKLARNSQEEHDYKRAVRSSMSAMAEQGLFMYTGYSHYQCKHILGPELALALGVKDMPVMTQGQIGADFNFRADDTVAFWTKTKADYGESVDTFFSKASSIAVVAASIIIVVDARNNVVRSIVKEGLRAPPMHTLSILPLCSLEEPACE